MAIVQVTQYLRPNGKQRLTWAEVPDEVAQAADEKDLILSAEVLPTDEVAIYCRRASQSEEEELIYLAKNGPGENSPVEKLIEAVMEA